MVIELERKFVIRAMGFRSLITGKFWWYVQTPDGGIRVFPTGWEDALDWANDQAHRLLHEVP